MDINNRFVFGVLFYIFVKVTGYSAFGYYLKKSYGLSKNPLHLGLVRTVIGIIFGIVVLPLFRNSGLKMDIEATLGGLFILFTIVRPIEWLILFSLFLPMKTVSKTKMISLLFVGSLVSFVLDFPLLFGTFLIIPFRLC